MIITLSGPAASGKGTLARMLSSHLGLPHYDFGLLFRAIALVGEHFNFDGIKKIIEIKELYLSDGKVFLRNRDITDWLRTETNGLRAAKLASSKASLMAVLSQSMVIHNDFVCDGRTCGTEIYPRANYRFYITANQKERFLRRSLEVVDSELLSVREELDQNRLNCEGLITVDTTGKTKEDSLQEILSFIN